MRIAFATLGCKINQYETDSLSQDLKQQGDVIVPFDAEADVYIINTCSVTAKSDTQSRQLIRAAVRRAKGARIIVTGCYAETRPDELKALDGVGLVIGNSEKTSIPSRIRSSFSDTMPVQADRSLLVKAVQGRTSAFLKIQTGCNNRCSYCIVPSARGSSRSAAVSDVIDEFDRLVASRCPEIVLTGIHVGSYGSDLEPQTTLLDLTRSLVARRGESRVRLSSIEPNEVSDELVSLLGNGLCRHLHIPLQSGEASILTAMRRNYTPALYLDLLQRIAAQIPDVALGADVMVGFPGEGEKEFQNTVDLITRSPLTHLHVFSYSPRPGTDAAAQKDQVPEQIKKMRSEVLRRLGEEKNYTFRKKLAGTLQEIVLEDKMNAQDGLFSGLTDNYIRVAVQGVNKDEIGRKLQVSISAVEKSMNFALKY